MREVGGKIEALGKGRESQIYMGLEWNKERSFLPHYEVSELFHDKKIKRLLAGKDVGMMSVLF